MELLKSSIFADFCRLADRSVNRLIRIANPDRIVRLATADQS
jgi:hypothetical protein